MTSVYKGDLRRSLEEQGFRVRDVDGRTWEVKTPEDADLSKLTNPSGIVRIHTTSFGKENSAFTAILSELRKIGYDPSWVHQRLKGQASDSLEEQTGLVEYRREPDPEGDPDDVWLTFEEAGSRIGISGGGVSQRVKSKGLRTVELPVERKAFSGTRTVMVLHVNLKDLKESGERRSSVPRAPVKSRFDTSSAAGRLSEAVSRVKSAMHKIESGMGELRQASAIIEQEAGGALEELRELKQRQRDIEKQAERLLTKF